MLNKWQVFLSYFSFSFELYVLWRSHYSSILLLLRINRILKFLCVFVRYLFNDYFQNWKAISNLNFHSNCLIETLSIWSYSFYVLNSSETEFDPIMNRYRIYQYILISLLIVSFELPINKVKSFHKAIKVEQRKTTYMAKSAFKEPHVRFSQHFYIPWFFIVVCKVFEYKSFRRARNRLSFLLLTFRDIVAYLTFFVKFHEISKFSSVGVIMRNFVTYYLLIVVLLIILLRLHIQYRDFALKEFLDCMLRILLSLIIHWLLIN